eukprot:2181458-Rhodomonas_salina.1
MEHLDHRDKFSNINHALAGQRQGGGRDGPGRDAVPGPGLAARLPVTRRPGLVQVTSHVA